MSQCQIDEHTSPYGTPHTCFSVDDCQGERYCSPFGWCRGKPFCGALLPDGFYDTPEDACKR